MSARKESGRKVTSSAEIDGVGYDPSVDRQRLDRLEAEFHDIVASFSGRRPLVRGRLKRLRRRCGKRGCRCQRGELHETLVLIDRRSGVRRVRKVVPGELLRLEEPARSWQRLRRLRARLSQLHREVLQCCDRLTESRLREGSRLLR